MPDTVIGRFVNDLRFQHPFCCLVSGTTGVGKSTFVKHLIERDGIKGVINEIYYFMPSIEKIDIKVAKHQKLYLMEGLPTKKWMNENWSPTKTNKDVCFIIDDLWDEVLKDSTCKRICTWGRNHLGISTAFITQYYFEQHTKAQMMKYVYSTFKLTIYF